MTLLRRSTRNVGNNEPFASLHKGDV